MFATGFINYLDPNNPKVPRQVIKGHNKPITGMEVSYLIVDVNCQVLPKPLSCILDRT